MRYILILLFVIGCNSQTRPIYPVTPVAVAESTFRVDIAIDDKPLGFGTAWVVKYDEDTDYSFLLTAGHVCDMPVPVKWYLRSKDDVVYKATEFVTLSIEPDLCLLKIKGFLARPLHLARKEPKYGDPVAYVGAPAADWGEGVAPYVSGNYMGHGRISTATAPGASGSPVFTKNGVFGVLVTVDMRFHHFTGYVGLEAIRKFLDDNKL